MPPKKRVRVEEDEDDFVDVVSVARTISNFRATDKLIKNINISWNTTTPQTVSLYTATFSCRIKSFFWDITICGNKDQETPLQLSWFLIREEDGAGQGAFSLTNGTNSYVPEENLLVSGSTILKPGKITSTTLQDNSDPSTKWITNFTLTAADPTRTTSGTIEGVLEPGTVPPAPSDITAAISGTIAAGDIEITGTGELQQDAALLKTTYRHSKHSFKGSSPTYRDFKTGDNLLFAITQGSSTIDNTMVFGTVQFFILA